MKELDSRLRAAVTILPVVGLFAESVQVNAQPQKEILSVPEGYVFNMEKGIPSMREALNARGLDLDVEAQQNPTDFCTGYQFCINFDYGGKHNVWRATNGGSDPDCPDSTMPRIDTQVEGVKGISFQPNKPFYTEINPCTANGGQIALGDILVDPNLGKGILTTVEVLSGSTGRILKPKGGEQITDLNDPGNLSKRVKITDSGLPQQVTDGGDVSQYINKDGQVNLVRKYLDASSDSEKGTYDLLADGNGLLVGTSWGKETNSTISTATATKTATVTPTPTVTPTVTPTRTATPNSRETATPITSIGTFGLTEMSSNTFQINVAQVPGSIGRLLARVSPTGLQVSPSEGLYPSSQTNFIDTLPANMTGAVCEIVADVTNTGSINISRPLCDLLGSRSGIAADHLSISSDSSNTITLGWRAPGGQTDYIFAALASGRVINLDGTATSVIFPGTSATECYIGFTRMNGNTVGNTNVVCII